MVTMLERLSFHKALRLAYGHRIVVTSEDGHLRQYQLLRYSGFDRHIGRHTFLVRDVKGGLATVSDVQLGLVGGAASARLGEPERLTATIEIEIRQPVSA